MALTEARRETAVMKESVVERQSVSKAIASAVMVAEPEPAEAVEPEPVIVDAEARLAIEAKEKPLATPAKLQSSVIMSGS